MIFNGTDRDAIHRAASVAAQFDPSDGWVQHGYNVALAGDSVTLDARRGVIFFRDADGEYRPVNLPKGITAEAVSAMLAGLSAHLPPPRPGRRAVLPAR